MKRTTINSTTWLLRIWKNLIILLLGLSGWACTDDNRTDLPGVDTDEALVQLSITAPGSSLPTPQQRVMPLAVNFEYDITHIRVLVFDKETDRFLYMVKGQQVRTDETNSQKTNFNALLKTSSKPLRLMLVANAEEAFLSYTPARGDSGEMVRKKITESFEGNFISEIPMYGEKELSSLDATIVNPVSVTMLRTVARIDVELELDRSKSNDFLLKEVYIYRANSRLQVIPDKHAVSGSNTLKVTSPSVPADATSIDKYDKKFELPQNTIEQLYVPEAVGGLANSDYGKVTCVVVGGNYNGEDEISYYRADFHMGDDQSYGQVLRNHRYLFKIKGVTGSGWNTPDEAAENKATLMNVEIKMWEDFTMEMYANGDNYLGITSRKLVFPYKEGLTKVISIQATVPYKISWQGSSDITTLDGPAISNEYFTAKIIHSPGDPGDVSYIEITTCRNNLTDSDFTSQLKVEWGSWIFYVTITQQHYKNRARKAIRVLSAHRGGTGALGETDGTSVNGGVMRKKLSNVDNFSGTGTVNYFSGFSFSQVPDRAWLTNNSAGTNNASKFIAELYSSDVLYLVNDNLCSPFTAGVIMEWLQGSPNRVLIMGGDGVNTSTAFLVPVSKYYPGTTGLLTNDIDWWYNTAVDGSQNYQRISNDPPGLLMKFCSLTEDTEDFFNGPFGQVDLTDHMRLRDEIFGYAKNIYNKDIIPLLYHSNLQENQPTLAVDKKRRIFFHGDASIFEHGSSTYEMVNNEKITNNQEKFWGNVWAWIAYQVIWGDDELIND